MLTFDLVFVDDKASPEYALVAAEQLIAAEVDAIVGHFNSDCARIAGQVYRRAGIPFLMPASTAPDLVFATGGIRICPTDVHQIMTMVAWLSRNRLVGNIEEDGSTYGARLGYMLRDALGRKTTAADSRPARVILGTHRSVATLILNTFEKGQIFLVPDDCAIHEFQEMLADCSIRVFVAQPKPNFARAVRISFELLVEARDAGGSLRDALHANKRVAGGQLLDAKFSISQINR